MKNYFYHIGIDGCNLALKYGTGIATYTRTLIITLEKLNINIDLFYGLQIKQSAEFEETLRTLERKNLAPFPFYSWWSRTIKNFIGHVPLQIENLNHISNIPYHTKLYNISDLFRLAHGFFKTTGLFLKVKMPNPPEIMHWTYPVPIHLIGARNIYTLHDLVPLLMPETTLDNEKLYHRLIMKIVKDADAICTVSESSKEDIINLFPKATGKIFNTYQTILTDEAFIPLSQNEIKQKVREITGCNINQYYLYFGALEPKKNIGRLIKAFLSSCASRPLVIVGSSGWKQEDELKLLPQAIKEKTVIHIPYLLKIDLLCLIKFARAVLFPSISEGFGLPVLEAMTQGTPVLTSNMGALKEVAGEATLLVDPYNVLAISKGIKRLDEDDTLCKKLSELGLKQKEKFNLINYQERLKNMYDWVLKKNKKWHLRK